jgi:membrane protein
MKEKIIRWVKKHQNKKGFLFGDQLAYRFQEDKVSSIGAQLTYYLILSIFPFLIFLLNIIQYTPLAQDQVLNSLVSVLPGETQSMILSIINEIINSSSNTLLSISVLATLWTASSGFAQVLRAINEAYDIKKARSFIKLRLVALLFTLGFILLIVIIFMSLIFGEVIGNQLFDLVNGSSIFLTLWPFLRIIIALGFLVLTFTLLYKYGPAFPDGKRMKFKDALPGAIFVSIGWALTSLSFSFYVNNFGNYTVTYGSLGGIIVFLIWLYISSIIIVLGGEVNATIEFLQKNNWKYSPEKSVVRDALESFQE